MPLNFFYYCSYFMSDRTAAIYLCQSLTPTDVSPHPLTRASLHSASHSDRPPIPLPIQLKCSFQTHATCLIYFCVCESAESRRICPVGQSLHVCFSDGFGSLTHMQAYCSLKSPVSCSSLTTLLTPDVWVFSPHTNQFSNSPDTIWVSYNSVLTLSARVSGDPNG